MNYFFTSESVSEGHPDKVADQISDAILDQLLAGDPNSRVACETLVTTGQVIVSGEVRSNAYVDLDATVRRVVDRIGYNKPEYGFDARSCGILSAIHDQSNDINRGVDRGNPEEQGAGDQGMMFGYATTETANYMPLPLDLSNALLFELAEIRKKEPELMPYLRPDAKSQVTVEYDEQNHPVRIDTIVLSTQHDEFIKPADSSYEAQHAADLKMQEQITEDIRRYLLPRVEKYYPQYANLFEVQEYRLLVNPTGKFVIGGPHGDTGLTGRKIIVDTYGGRASHGGGAFSGKDCSKVDRSGAYAARHIAKNMVAAGVCSEMLVQLSYAIGVAEPVSIYVRTSGKTIDMSDGEIAQHVLRIFDLRPYAIEQRFDLRKPIYEETAAYGHFGRDVRWVKKSFETFHRGTIEMEVELFPWEKLDYVERIRQEFGL
ncbi:methionine adenosyltransferase [Porphyromonas asaccharolytica]|uniref:S-adenosylmethionine synthase n=1 Tax=Porphyromonas asaccharolytica (strain ATCC 25260 / DSM 20707 / BCRC 10618 / CCUG 7834 / JCM 6326 / LMG 13178 / VPI 4198 / B440) TaxID=879243 RepID=F4KLC4_PORAD|nr:methionine adenosyltransferase [Porphyromonas asaccharolytica]AEE13072.1 S-adenosylmethionine synthase [Porphyromonas asaccharolytica DSM 20707]